MEPTPTENRLATSARRACARCSLQNWKRWDIASTAKCSCAKKNPGKLPGFFLLRFKDLLACLIQPGNFLVGQLPAESARVFLRLSSILGAGNDKRPFADRPVQRHLCVRLAPMVLPDE